MLERKYLSYYVLITEHAVLMNGGMVRCRRGTRRSRRPVSQPTLHPNVASSVVPHALYAVTWLSHPHVTCDM